MPQESCWPLGSRCILPTSISHRACNSLQSWVSGQKTSPCTRTRWQCVLKTFFFCYKLTLICWNVLVPNKRFMVLPDVCNLACSSLTHSFSNKNNLGSFQNKGYTNMILKDCHLMCCCLIGISSCTVKCTLVDHFVIAWKLPFIPWSPFSSFFCLINPYYSAWKPAWWIIANPFKLQLIMYPPPQSLTFFSQST